DARKPSGGVDRFKLAVDIDLAQLGNRDDCRIPVLVDIARRYLNGQPLFGAVTELAHDVAGFGAVRRNTGTLAGQAAQHFRWHAPNAIRRRQDGAADRALAFRHDVDEGFVIETQRHRAPQLDIVEWRRCAVDDQIAAIVVHDNVAERLRSLAE